MAKKQMKLRRFLQNDKTCRQLRECNAMNRGAVRFCDARRPSFVATALGVWLIILTSYGCGQKPPSIEPKPIPNNAEGASLVFLGTVAKPVDGGMNEARAVRVDRIYFQRGTFDDQTGSEVIVFGKALPATGQYVFHVEPSQFGARVQAQLKFAEPRKPYTDEEIKQLRHEKRKLELLPRVKSAGLIFVGSVESARPWDGRKQAESEHDPQWSWATAKVGESLLGKTDETHAEFLFPTSVDVHWWQSPKPRKGVEKMFLLRKGAEGIDQSLSGTWTLLHKDDLLEGEDTDIVREIINKGGAK